MALAGDHAEKVKEKDILSKTVEQLQQELDIALKKAAEQVTLLFILVFIPLSLSPSHIFLVSPFYLYLSLYLVIYIPL